MFTKGMRMSDYEYSESGNRVVYVDSESVDVGHVIGWSYTSLDNKPIRLDLDLTVSEVISTEKDDYGLLCVLKIDSAYLIGWKEIKMPF